MRFSMGTMMSQHEKISDSHLELFIVFHRFSTKPSLPYPDFGLQATTIGIHRVCIPLVSLSSEPDYEKGMIDWSLDSGSLEE